MFKTLHVLYAAMASRSKWATARAEDPEASKAKRRKTTNGGGGGDTPRSQLSLPLWSPKTLGLGAYKGALEASVGDALFMTVLAPWPDSIKYLLLERLLKHSGDSQFFKNHEEDIRELHSILEDCKNTIDSTVELTRMSAVLAAHLGAGNGIQDPAVSLPSDSTIVMDKPELASIPIMSRCLPELCAYDTAPAFLTEKGDIRCWCQQAMVLKTKQAWAGRGPPTQYFSCASGGCRLHITMTALTMLRDLMTSMGVTRVPKWFCPLHPAHEIRIIDCDVDGARKLKARCSWYERGVREFCVSELIGPDGANYAATGEPLWKALDMLTRT
jgi:hypothetical protein